MRIPQLTGAAVIVALGMTVACNRAETREQTERAAEELKTAAARAGDTLADGWVTTRVQARYFADDQIKGRYIDVSTRDGVVTVKGFVDSQAARERALLIARGTDGVKQVNDQLLIGQRPAAVEPAQQPVATGGDAAAAPTLPPGQTAAGVAARADDARLTATIQARYFLDATVKGRRIDVDSRGGVVTLSGEVASEAERAQALLLARTTEGVVRVEDHLTVNAGLHGRDE